MYSSHLRPSAPGIPANREIHINKKDVDTLGGHQRLNFLRVLGCQHIVKMLPQQQPRRGQNVRIIVNDKNGGAQAHTLTV